MSSRDFLRPGFSVGVGIGIAVALPSFRYTQSVAASIFVGVIAALLAGLAIALTEDRYARERAILGAPRSAVPIRVRLCMDLQIDRTAAMNVCRRVIHGGSLRIKRVESEQDDHIVAVTKNSWRAFSQRVEIRVSAIGSLVRLEAASVPRMTTAQVDGGANYLNLFRLKQAIETEFGNKAIVQEEWVDMDTGSAFVT